MLRLFRRLTGRGKSASGNRSTPQTPVLEIQIHPGDIRRRVTYFFLTRRHLQLLAAAGVAVLLYVGWNAVVLPRVLGEFFGRREYQALVAERDRHGQRLEALTGRLRELGGSSEELHLKMSRIYLAYGLESGVSEGQGGFPFEERSVPQSVFQDQIREGVALEAGIHEQMGVLDTFIQEVQAFEEAHGDQVETTPSTSPLRGQDFVLTSPFGSRRSPFTKKMDLHAGLDLAAPVGTQIYAPADARVVYAGRFPLRQSVAWWRYGNMVALRHGDRFISLYGHCDEVRVRQGQRVDQGQVIATVGNSGWSTSPHLHYEIRTRLEDGTFKPIDPRIYILDHRWRNQEAVLVRARSAPGQRDYQPLPRLIGRR